MPHAPRLEVDDSEALPPALDFMRSIWGVNHTLERVSKRMELGMGITAQQRMMLRWIGRFPGIVPGLLAKQLHVDAGTISSTVSRLERRGLVSRKPDPADGRRVTLWLTPNGQRLDIPTRGTVEHGVDEMLRALPARDVTVARRVLSALMDALHHESTAPDISSPTRATSRRTRRRKS
jgi:DNA-binding MarR family transcriptional regulator